MSKLALVVPYRNRPAHLQQFVTHLRAYFARDRLDRAIAYRVLVIEQDNALAFNRGMLLDIGFLLAEADSDYVCFHDVDHLPIWADYSPVDRPTSLAWYGAPDAPAGSAPPGTREPDPRAGGASHGGVDPGGALLVPSAQFRQVGGFATGYWDRAFEDTDLIRRFDRADIALARRKGTFQVLDHDTRGAVSGDLKLPIRQVDQQIFDARWAPGAGTVPDGLDTLDYQIMRRQEIPDPRPERAADWQRITVRLKAEPTAEQAVALAAAAREEARPTTGRRR